MTKTALITGGTRGIGFGIAQKFRSEGYRVALNYKNDDDQAREAISKLGEENAILVKGDIACSKEREIILEQVLQKFGRLDVLVNNAGILRYKKFIEIDESLFETIMQTNFYGPLFLAQCVAKHWIKNKQAGAIVNICTVGVYRPGDISYSTTKSALNVATGILAKELAPHAIRVNSVSPGLVPTELNAKGWRDNPEQWQKRVEKVPFQRVGTPQEIGAAVYFLASQEASYITGRDLVVDGGYLLN